jgi:hypothetical protein
MHWMEILESFLQAHEIHLVKAAANIQIASHQGGAMNRRRKASDEYELDIGPD